MGIISEFHEKKISYSISQLVSELYKMTQLLGSALLSVLVEKNSVNEKKAWILSRIEEDWQKKIWGKDEESIEAEKNKRKDFKLLNLCLRNLIDY